MDGGALIPAVPRHPAYRDLGSGMTIEPGEDDVRIVGGVGPALQDLVDVVFEDDEALQRFRSGGAPIERDGYRVVYEPSGEDVEAARAEWREALQEDPGAMVSIDTANARWIAPVDSIDDMRVLLKWSRDAFVSYRGRRENESTAEAMVAKLVLSFGRWWEAPAAPYGLESTLREVEATAVALDGMKDDERAAAKRRALLVELHGLGVLERDGHAAKRAALIDRSLPTLVAYHDAALAALDYLESAARAERIFDAKPVPVLASRVSVDLFRLGVDERPQDFLRWVIAAEERFVTAADRPEYATGRMDLSGGVTGWWRRDNAISQAVYRLS